MTDLDSLIEELEEATEDNQYIFIYDVLQLAHREGWITARKFDQASNWRFNGAYLDAALTLVPEGWEWSIHSDGTVNLMPPDFSPSDNPNHINGEAATPALALCIAALKARRE